MKKTLTVFLLITATGYFLSCVHEPATNLDIALEDMLSQRSATGSYEAYIMPASDDYAALPNQDAKNPVTEAKVKLGKMLFFETGLGLEPKYPVSKVAYSCSSCHIPSRGFTAGR
ncbi:MAG TPA: cytochrome c peroxidase, partial [Saprospiraceae bacterium]|nr:cytochrome c peroxidase [Saprospiraceae bacterium]